MAEQSTGTGLIVVSNRLPFVVRKEGEVTQARAATGGLVTALVPVLRNRGGIWIGWSGTAHEDAAEEERILETAAKDAGYKLKSVPISRDEVEKFYLGFCNEILWPLFHDMPSYCNFDPAYWAPYCTVNRRYAEVIARNSKKGDFVWIHDYHLMCTARELRGVGADVNTGFFLHIPFPPLDMFLRLPWRREILQALLDFNLLGFQTMRDRRNFVQCVEKLFPEVSVSGKGQVQALQVGKRKMRVGSFSIGIDFKEFSDIAQSEEVEKTAWFIRETLPKCQLILGVDRLDYTKGIPYKLKAYRDALRRHPELQQRVTLVQATVPSREVIPGYHDLKDEIERLVGEINGEFTRYGWVPVHYMFRYLSRKDLLAYYRAADVAFVTPLKDGMNLVAKEFCASSVEESCVLVLSEFAGAASQMQKGAILVNPFDVEGMADALHRACTMPDDQRRERMGRLRKMLRGNDIFRWVDSFLLAAIAKDLSAFPVQEEYVPQI
ncbi:MAG: alpha,alpha-trehalose-phosphate synthase (UDP-forming) [Planctomycetota bacterium]|jgi:trehalose 6-phosphate synthase